MSDSPRPFSLAPGIELGPGRLPFIVGPCVLEDERYPGRTLATAERIAAFAEQEGLELIFKASFDKANRSSIHSFRGPGLERGLEILSQVAEKTGLSVTTDVHQPEQCGPVAEVCPLLQIPAFLCRQTDLLVAAGETGRAVNVKKGQFVAPEDMRHAVEKVRSTGNDRVVVTERGTSFGYRNLVVDMRSFEMLHELGIPVIFDITHSLQLPGAAGAITGGDRRFAEPLARAAVAAGADGIFVEAHLDPESALSDKTTQLPIARAERLLRSLTRLHRALES